MEIGDEFIIHKANCRRVGSRSAFAERLLMEDERQAFIDTIPETALPHLSEKDIDDEYFHHYGKP